MANDTLSHDGEAEAAAGLAPTTDTTTDPQRHVELARRVGRLCAETAERHDRDGTFVHEGYEAMKALRYLALPVPVELGGSGASLTQVCHAQAELARHCGSSALSATMHLYNTFVLGARRRAGAADAEAALRRISGEGLVVTTSGGSDWLWPTAVAVEHDGGYRVSGRKVFNSQAPVGDVMTTSAVVGEPGPGAEVLHFAMPMRADGVTVVETWDTLGMRGTASHDVVLRDVFVPADRVLERRPWGRFGRSLLTSVTYFAPLGASVYWGIGAGARDHAVALLDGRRRGPAPAASLDRVQRQVGLMDSRLRVSWWALLGALAEVGETPEPSHGTVATLMIAKRECVLAAREVVDLAMDVVGGGSYFRTSPLERAFRDVRAGGFHPFTPEATLIHAGRLALGGDLSAE
jgi:acyl-CoA dehydrogenase